MSKHEDIINYILSLEIGTKISVRKIAAILEVSEGTAYRAIKESEKLGAVTTIPRVGTIRIKRVEKKSIETLTFAEIVNIVDGTILGGKSGIHKTLSKFVIGAMTIDAMEKYISPANLLIVGNREDAQRLALINDSAVLITGGFDCSDEIKNLADEKSLPIISSTYDTFTVASMINKAIYESLIKKDIILVEDIMKTKLDFLSVKDKVQVWKDKMKTTKQERYPVVDNDMKVVGILTFKDMPVDIDGNEPISKYMTKNPITVTPKTTVAYTAHIMGWEDIEICPVIKDKKLIGVITRQDVIKSLHYATRQPQVGETIEDLILKNFEYENKGEKIHFHGKIIPEMLDSLGTASWGAMNMLITTIGNINLRKNNINSSVDNIITYFLKPVQMDNVITVDSEIIDMGRNFCKVQIDVFNNKKEQVAMSLMSAKVLRQ